MSSATLTGALHACAVRRLSAEVTHSLSRGLSRPCATAALHISALDTQFASAAALHSPCTHKHTHSPLCAGWLRERSESVYQQLEGFDASIKNPLAGEPGPPRELPDTLRGEAWQFVQLPLSDLQAELAQAQQVRAVASGETSLMYSAA